MMNIYTKNRTRARQALFEKVDIAFKVAVCTCLLALNVYLIFKG